MAKKLLLIMNPIAGVKKTNKYLVQILSKFCDKGYECTTQMTTESVRADKIVDIYGKDKDLLVCVGGDGTFNEMVSGILRNNLNVKIGYIPAGSTNDFANGIGISQDPLVATDDIINGKETTLDVGFFNDRVFTYVASFGVFTKTSYNTPRDLKNSLGYFAYVLEGIKEITDLQAFHVKIESIDKTVEGKYVFGGISNSKRIGGGLIRFSDDVVSMNDGLLEIFLVKFPENPAEFLQLLLDLQAGKYTSHLFEFFSAKEVTITTNQNIDWTIDGEYQKGSKKITIKNVKDAITLYMKKD